ncbi:MAG: hypothetical protein HWD61_00815 [Parachlamydiaceae bacterium]|nr:MAG: hypothetical protein HWD61_00815 [Parachlamydiaceae bacterium]
MNKVGLQFLSPEITFIIMDFAPEISSLSLTCKKLNQVANGWLEKTNTQILNFYPPLLNELIENTRVIGKKIFLNF